MNQFKKILVLAPHTDDGEFGCGGAMSKFIDLGYDIAYRAFSAAQKSIPDNMPIDITKTELKNAMGVYGMKKGWQTQCYDFPVREFPEHRQSILDAMLNVKCNYMPDLVLIPSTFDTHQDHQVICQEGIRAFKHTTILGYELPWNNLTFRHQCFIELSKKNLADKIAAIACYKSQKDRIYANPEVTEALAVTRGTQIGKEYAEVFEVIRWIM